MTFAKRQQRRRAERPITCRYKLWAAFFMGAASHFHPGRVRGPLHPDLRDAFDDGVSAAIGGWMQVPNLAEAWELARHVEAGNAPHTFTGQQLGMAL